MVPGRYGDGDSFHTATPAGERIFRLYFVDTPETDSSFPDRVKDQADYFGITPKRALEIGHEAKVFTEKMLHGGFAVYTRGEDAEGRSEMQRFFALIKVGDRWLDVALVEAGLARVFGKQAVLPDGTTAKKHWSDLREAEERAKKAHAGAWGVGGNGAKRTAGPERPAATPASAPSPSVPPTSAAVPEASDDMIGRTVVLARGAALLTDDLHPRFDRILPPGTELTVLRVASAGLVRVRLTLGGRRVEGHCRAHELGAAAAPAENAEPPSERRGGRSSR